MALEITSIYPLILHKTLTFLYACHTAALDISNDFVLLMGSSQIMGMSLPVLKFEMVCLG